MAPTKNSKQSHKPKATSRSKKRACDLSMPRSADTIKPSFQEKNQSWDSQAKKKKKARSKARAEARDTKAASALRILGW
ncbi:hypothetical protein IFR04_015238 [Cadophora malorum]|uniref:Uncharacterized protein n=1 Tax=Cadophora malorum TaxID=108018 RepID=A0A8H7T169_9HELO|nr:hypothetical protein IFR04_015238 [Cadophora malorum]